MITICLMLASVQRVLAVAAKCGRIGCVFLDDGELVHWDISETGAASTDAAAEKLHEWLETYQPDCLISENPDTASRKAGKQIPILRTFAQIGEEQSLLNMIVPRHLTYPNLYVEAESLAEQFPDLKPCVPAKPQIWHNEPRQLVYFEALALVKQALIGDSM